MIARSALTVPFTICLFLLSTAARGDFIVTSQLTGDSHSGNPDNLLIDVRVEVEANVAHWLIDINSPLHPDAKLGGFYFNLALLPEVTASFSNITPDNSPGKQWVGFSPADNVSGSGNADFNFGVDLRGSGSSKPNAVTNSTNLTFDLTLSGSDFNESMFTGAMFSKGGGIPLSGAQMGAHLQSLVVTGHVSDGGFASGHSTTIANPEPSSILLAGVGAFSCCVAALRRKRALTQ